MRAVYIHGPGDVRMDTVPDPVLGEQDVMVKVSACGICGTDVTFAKLGLMRPTGEPLPLGHEVSGVITEVGARAANGFRPGMRVVLNPMNDTANVVGNGGSEGGFADMLLVRSPELGRGLYEAPDSMALERAALTEPLGVALHGVNRADPRPESKVVVVGAGPIGLGAVLWLKRRGVRSIVSVDLSATRLDYARRLGATDVIQAGREDVRARLLEIHGAGADVLTWPTLDTDIWIDMAGAPGVIPDVVAMSKFHAKLVIVAVHAQPVPVDFQTMLLKEMTVLTSVGYPSELPDVIEALTTLSDEEIAPFVSHSFPFDQFPQAFEAAKSPESAKVVVTF